MRNKSALSKNKEEVWKSMALPNNVLEHYTSGRRLLKLDLKKKSMEYDTESYLNRRGLNSDGGLK